MDAGELLTVRQISEQSAEAIGVALHVRRVYRWIECGKLPAVRVGDRLHVRRSDLRRWLPQWPKNAGKKLRKFSSGVSRGQS